MRPSKTHSSATKAHLLRLLCLLMLVGPACSDNQNLVIQGVPAQYGQVGGELTVEFTVLNTAGRAPRFRASSETIPDLNSRPQPPRFVPFGSGSAYFRWTPNASDVGEHILDIEASVGSSVGRTTLVVSVNSGTANPVFIRPLGSGNTLDLATANCFEFSIEVEDPDDIGVEIYLETPQEPNYLLSQTEPFRAEFRWCPDRNQIVTSSRYEVHLAARDEDGHVGRKTYMLLLRQQLDGNCPGEDPVIEHEEVETLNSTGQIELTARIGDDRGIAPPPILFYALDAPVNPDNLNVDLFSPVDMTKVSGTERDGVYVAAIAMSDLGDAAGEEFDIFYFIEVQDDDDPGGNCDHRTVSPKRGVHRVRVTREMSPVGPSACGSCTSDGDCPGGLCVAVDGARRYCLNRCEGAGPVGCENVGYQGCCDGRFVVWCSNGSLERIDCQQGNSCGWDDMNMSYICGPESGGDPSGQFPRACPSAGSTCPQGYQCSGDQLTSVDGISSAVCIPLPGQCESDCTDDEFEPNDSTLEVQSPLVNNRNYEGLNLCANGVERDNDYFGLSFDQPVSLTTQISFSHALGDIDMTLLNFQGEVVARSGGFSDTELITRCIDAGFYYVHVYSVFRNISSDYDLLIQSDDAVACCIDDVAEEDDNWLEAYSVRSGEAIESRKVCGRDEDWYAIDLRAQQELTVNLEFLHERSDLDVFVYGTDGITNLTPCCQNNNGHSSTDNETLVHRVDNDGIYYVVVRGFNEAENEYRIDFSVF